MVVEIADQNVALYELSSAALDHGYAVRIYVTIGWNGGRHKRNGFWADERAVAGVSKGRQQCRNDD